MIQVNNIIPVLVSRLRGVDQKLLQFYSEGRTESSTIEHELERGVKLVGTQFSVIVVMSGSESIEEKMKVELSLELYQVNKLLVEDNLVSKYLGVTEFELSSKCCKTGVFVNRETREEVIYSPTRRMPVDWRCEGEIEIRRIGLSCLLPSPKLLERCTTSEQTRQYINNLLYSRGLRSTVEEEGTLPEKEWRIQ